jgi:hypothetical protein
MRLAFRHSIRHPLYPGLKPAPAVDAKAPTSALTGTYTELTRAAARGVQVARAVFLQQSPTDPFPTEEQRESLWEMFEVPVLAMLVDHRGSVIGHECELQEGYHLKEDSVGGLPFARVESGLCECGRPGPRLMPAEDTSMTELVSLASAAD